MARPEDGDEWLRLNGAGENLTWAAADFENFAQPRPVLASAYEVEFEKAVRLLMENGWGFRLHATYDMRDRYARSTGAVDRVLRRGRGLSRRHGRAGDDEFAPVPHFGLILTVPEFRALADRLRAADTEFVIEPYVRFEARTRRCAGRGC